MESAWLYVMEFFSWRQFANRREVGALAGLTPTPYQSGESHREQGIAKAGNRHVRAMAIEIAWAWLRFQPDSALARWYTTRFGHGPETLRIRVLVHWDQTRPRRAKTGGRGGMHNCCPPHNRAGPLSGRQTSVGQVEEGAEGLL